jgi:type I restriction enzyme S subunit
MSFPRYERYKDSGPTWFGRVPSHWAVLDGRRVFTQKRDASLPDDPQLSATQKYGVIPQTLFMELEQQKVVLALKGTDAFKHVEIDDFIISLRSFQGGIEKSHFRGCVSTAYTVLRSTKNIQAKYWEYLLKSSPYIDALSSVTDGIREGRSISYSQFGGLPLPFPSVHEQTAIAAFLDYETAKIDALIEEQRRLIELLKEKRQAIISHAVTRGLNPDAPVKDCGVDWIGLIPQHWEVSKLGQTANIVRGGSPRPAGDSRFFNGDFMPWITVGEVTKDDSMYLVATESMLTEVGAEQSRTIDSGTLVLTNSGATLGVPKILGITGCANDGILAFLDLKANANKKYLYFVLGSLTSELRERMKQGSGQPNLNTGIVSALQVPLPPVVEQLAIVAELERMQDEFGALMAQAETSVTLLQERRSALISAAVTGKVDVRHYTPKEAS